MQQVIQFVEKRPIHKMVYSPSYDFAPVGMFKWFQRALFNFLLQVGALKHSRHDHVSYDTHIVVQPERALNQILKQKSDLMRCFNRKGNIIYIGSSDYAELMQCKEMMFTSFSFNTKGYNPMLEMEVRVIPWMKGILIVPKEV
jgi:hypothetical protein